MAKVISWSPSSERDFSAILEYLSENWDIRVASRFIDSIDSAIQQISIHPQQFPLIQKKEKIRKCVLSKHHTLYYRERKGHVSIVRIYDNRQDPQKLLFH